MCNHYRVDGTRELISALDARWRGGAPPELLADDLWPGRYGPVVLQEDGERVAEAMRWKLLISDRKGMPTPHNARADKLGSPFYRSVWPHNRCLIPATAYYERHQTERISYRIAPEDGSPLVLAGVYAVWRPADAEPVWSYAMVTTEPSRWAAPIHNRMPAILDGAEAQAAWLDPEAPPADLLALLRPHETPLQAEPGE